MSAPNWNANYFKLQNMKINIQFRRGPINDSNCHNNSYMMVGMVYDGLDRPGSKELFIKGLVIVFFWDG